MIQRWNPAGIAAPLAKYSHLARVDNLLFISGQVGVREDGTLAGPDTGTQTRQIFANIAHLLGSVGAGPQHLLKLVTYIAGTEHLAAFRAVWEEVFTEWYPDGGCPAHSVLIAAPVRPDRTVEIEAVAAIP